MIRPHRILLTGAVALLSALCGVCPAAASVTLVRAGAPASRIVTEADPPVTVRYAVRELQHYLEKISGARLPVAEETATDAGERIRPGIYLGATQTADALGIRADDLPPDGFRIVALRDEVLVLRGRDYRGPPLPGRHGRVHRNVTPDGTVRRYGETGTLNAVYRWLETLGVRWFLPGELGEVVPRTDTIVFDGPAVTDAPHFHYRNLYAFWFDKDPEAARWWKRVG